MSKYPLAAAMVVSLALPAAAQQIIQRRASDAPARATVRAALPAAPLLGADALAGIALADRLPRDVQRAERTMLRRVSERLRHKNRAAAQTDWERALGMIAKRDAKPDVDALANWVLHHAYLEPIPDLRMHAEKVRFFNDQKEAAYAARERLQKLKADLDGGQDAGDRMIRSVTLAEEYRPGVRAVIQAEPKPATVESVTPELASIVVLCNHADENSTQANLELQDAMQKQQQTLQTMSNVSKMLHDTAMAVIRKIGG